MYESKGIFMHEIALMGDILDLVSRDAKERGIEKITEIHLVVGELSNAMPDALEMAFDIYKAQGIELLDPEAQLVITVEEARAKCVLCGAEYKPDRRIALCPGCSMPSGKILAGETFTVHSYEGSEQDENRT